jgi:hypothetical protein
LSIAFLDEWTTEFYPGSGSGIATSAGVGNAISLGGLAYELDTSDRYRDAFKHRSVPQQRASFEDRENVGRGTLNPEAFWRRTFESWHVGAGQTHFDRIDDSNPWRFRRSRGINVWERYQVSLLPDTDGKRLTANTNLFLAVAGDFLYLTDGNTLQRTADITVDTPTFTSIGGVPATNASSIASDGFNVLTAHGTNGIYKTTRGAATSASNITGTVATVFYGKGRWIAAQDNNLYDVTTLVAGGGALPAAHFTHSNTDFDWNCFAEGPTALYAGGFSGDKSLIYQLTLKDDGTGLNQPVVAGFLPDGELIHAMQGYLGLVLIGTSKGVRVGIPNQTGELTIGAFIPTDEAVRCFEGQEGFVWFGWSNFEGTHTGLGRLSLETFSDSDALAPAYASDLMFAASGTVLSIATFQGLRVFTTNGAVIAEHTDNLVSSGEIDSGLFDFGLTDDKLSLFVDMAHIAHDGGTHSVYLSVDRAAFALLATMEEEHFPIATGEARGKEFEVRIQLDRNASDPEMGPTIRSWALRSQPVTPLTEEITVPLRIGPSQIRADSVVEYPDSVAQLENIVTLAENKSVVSYAEGDRAWSVIVADFEFDGTKVWVGQDTALGVKGTVVVRLKTVA